MFGAIIGDFAGSTYEFAQTKKTKQIKIKKLLKKNSFFSDDTICTIAVLDSILNKKDYGKTMREYVKKYENYLPNFKPYFSSAFSPNLIKWAKSTKVGTSRGNGALMRISPIGFLFDDKQAIIEQTKLATSPSHNSEEAIEYATKLSLMIYYLKNGYSKQDVCNFLSIKTKYSPFEKFNTTCAETFDNCIYAFLTTNSFESAIKKVISFGGDTDTNACIVGALAEAYYGIDEKYLKFVKEKLPSEFVELLNKAYCLMGEKR